MFNKITTLLIVVPIAIMVIGGIYAIATNYGSEDESYSYSSSEVIGIIQNAYPEFGEYYVSGEPALWSADYDGDNHWFVTTASINEWEATLFRPNESEGYVTTRIYYVWWFNEVNRTIDGPWVVTPQELLDKRGLLPWYDRSRPPEFGE